MPLPRGRSGCEHDGAAGEGGLDSPERGSTERGSVARGLRQRGSVARRFAAAECPGTGPVFRGQQPLRMRVRALFSAESTDRS